MFGKHDLGMTYHLKSLLIRAKIKGIPVIKVFIDKGAIMNLMSHSLLMKIGKSDANLQQHNTVLSNYEGKASHIFGFIQLDLFVGSTTRSTLFMVIPSKANYNMLLGSEWIHGIDTVTSTLH